MINLTVLEIWLLAGSVCGCLLATLMLLRRQPTPRLRSADVVLDPPSEVEPPDPVPKKPAKPRGRAP